MSTAFVHIEASTGTMSSVTFPDSKVEAVHIQKAAAPPPKPSLLVLPIEIILHVLDLSDAAADKICLALTCKWIYHSIRPLSFQRLVHELGKEEQGADAGIGSLLRRLERDTPGMFYCMKNQLLARFDGHEPSSPPASSKPTSEPPSLNFCYSCKAHKSVRRSKFPAMTVSFNYSQDYLLPWCTAHLVTIHQALGAEHGIPPSALARDCVARRIGRGVVCSQSWRAKVTPDTDELVVSCERSFRREDGLDDGTMTDLSKIPFFSQETSMCLHGGGLSVTPGDRDLDSPLSSMIQGSGGHIEGSCDKCETDWEITFVSSTPSGGGGGRQGGDARCSWGVVVRTYHCLGKCRSPDVKWHAMTSYFEPGRARPPGSAREAWRV